jgi:hypothetical protein
MTDSEFIGSHEKAENDYGQNGSPQSSSLTPGQTKPPIKNVAPPNATVPGLAGADTLAARLKGGSNSPDHPGMSHPSIQGATPAKLPGSPSAVRPPVKR